jgi:thymidylate synthase ThyX
MVFDCLRGLLPAATLTNLGFYGNGRFFESLLMKMRTEPLQEMQTIAENGFVELSKVIPSFVKRANKEHRHFKGYESYMQQLHDAIGSVLPDQAIQCDDGFRVSLVEKPTKEVIDEMCAALMYENTHYDFQSLKQVAKTMSEKRKKELFENLGNIRTNRRNKSPRALEHADFTFEIVADFGCYRDLHRHRILTQKRQHLTCFHGYVVPEEIVGTKMEPIFKEAMERAKSLFIDMHKVMPLQAQYVVPMGYNIRWYIKINLRALQWMCELRSTPQGHPEYRKVAQQMAQCVIDAFDVFRPLLKFVDFSEHAIGRLAQEERNLKKKQGS